MRRRCAVHVAPRPRSVLVDDDPCIGRLLHRFRLFFVSWTSIDPRQRLTTAWHCDQVPAAQLVPLRRSMESKARVAPKDGREQVREEVKGTASDTYLRIALQVRDFA